MYLQFLNVFQVFAGPTYSSWIDKSFSAGHGKYTHITEEITSVNLQNVVTLIS